MLYSRDLSNHSYVPTWMREERYEYCDVTDLKLPFRITSIWNKLLGIIL